MEEEDSQERRLGFSVEFGTCKSAQTVCKFRTLPERHFGLKQNPPDVDLSALKAAFSLPLPYRHRQGALAAMAMRRQSCGRINRHLEATPNCLHVAFDQNAALASFQYAAPVLSISIPKKTIIDISIYPLAWLP